MSRKFVYYLEGLSRSIVITDKDNDMSIEEISRYASEMMSVDKISKFQTKTDVLLVRPTELKAIHITDDYKDDLDSTIDDKNLQSFIPDIDLEDLEGTEENVDVTSTLETDVQEDEPIEENTEEEITIPEEVIEDANEINNSN